MPRRSILSVAERDSLLVGSAWTVWRRLEWGKSAPYPGTSASGWNQDSEGFTRYASHLAALMLWGGDGAHRQLGLHVSKK